MTSLHAVRQPATWQDGGGLALPVRLYDDCAALLLCHSLCNRVIIGALSRPPQPPPNAVYTDPRSSISYPAGLYLSTKMAMPPLGISESQVDVAIAAGDGIFAKSVVFKFQGSVSPMPYVNLTNVQAVWEAGKSMVSGGGIDFLLLLSRGGVP